MFSIYELSMLPLRQSTIINYLPTTIQQQIDLVGTMKIQSSLNAL